ncbi:hypothetical protein SAMN05192566_1561 [Methylophilus rhizosphaerae]|uniref:Uncharacterized protein n=1 Tax=Methylophilus rhizosphaerae TaxID=492660 RepID=A0A1G9CPA2_9PROT|nr:hypothetical protein [Methylophilus rhizosphaerae]SDK53511.1 hypothetical protein SAMN05192566_1561 [Methylophilus rhizosphaerae]
MPVIYDEEWGGYRVLLNPLLTIEEAVIALLGHPLKNYPFIYYDDLGNHEDTLTLVDYLNNELDSLGDDESVRDNVFVRDALKCHEQILDAIEGGDLYLHDHKLRAIKLVAWAKKKGYTINLEGLMVEVQTLTNISERRVPIYHIRKKEILNALTELGHKNPQQLPRQAQGHRGVKAAVKDLVLKKKAIFKSTKTFDDAWQQMRDEDIIAEATN